MSLPNFLQLIRDAEITSEMLEEVAIAVDDYVRANPDRKQDSDSVMWVTFETFKGRNLSPHVLTAIMFRMEALSRLTKAGKTKAWQLGDKDAKGAVSINVAVFAAAAQAKLIMSNRRGVPPRFNPDEFQSLALLASKPEGEA